MVGVLPLEVRMLPRLKALGYRQVTVTTDCPLGPAGSQGRGHEFHYSEICSETADLPKAYGLADRRGGAPVAEGYCRYRTLASYVHLHFGSNPELAANFVAYCQKYKEKR